ncbi:MAG TPA: fused MFS/spermidine synthase [Candidatus Limnocylindrales bacterium]|nr:fused MFS/spermidine synthase [Candidatus Limnocylindrales bacterium]
MAPNSVGVYTSNDPQNILDSSGQRLWMLPGVLALIGFTAVIAQIVLMRELMVVFNGNEMSLGIMLASWLVWTAIGSSALGRWAVRTKKARRLVTLLEVMVAVTFPTAIFLVRASKAVFQTVPGELLGPGSMMLTSLLVLSAFCVVSGGLFAAASKLEAQERGNSTSTGASRVYLFEAVGSGLGGVLTSIVLIRFLRPFEIAALVSMLNVAGAASLTIRSRARLRMILGALAVIFGLVVIPFGCGWAEKASLGRLWQGYQLVATRNSAYGNLVVTKTGGMHSLFENGLVAFNVPDIAAAEEAVHFALLEHPLPKSLLLVGGGMNGSLAQALQHASLERVDYVELDPEILALAQEYFLAEWAPVQRDPRVRVHHTDGRLFLKTTDLRFDVVIINLPDPQTAQLNRFYTQEFFQEVESKLSSTGVFSFSLRGAEDYISPELADFLRCIDTTLRGVFPEVVTIPGETIHFLASVRPGLLTVDPAELITRLRTRDLHTSYLREYYLPYRMMPDRMKDLESQLRPKAETRANHDFAPVAYFFNATLWSSQFAQRYRRMFQSMGRVHFGALLGTLAIGLFGLVAGMRWLRRTENQERMSAGFCVAAMGFTLIGLEMLLLLAFQAIYGYVYQQLAILIAGIMVGMALGSWAGMQSVETSTTANRSEKDTRWLIGLQMLAAVLPLVLCVVLQVFAAARKPPAIFLVSQIIFPLVAVVCGFVGGYQFPVASRVFFARSNGRTESPGALYALDLAGACLGALVLSSYLVPVFGFTQTAWLMAEVNLAPAVLAALLAFGK